MSYFSTRGGLDSGYVSTLDEPYPSTGTRLAVPLDNNDGLKSVVSSTLCKAPYIAIVVLGCDENDISGSELEIIPNTLRSLKRISCLDVLNWLRSNGVNVIAVPRTEKIFDALERLDTKLILVDPGLTLRDVLELFLNKWLVCY